MLSILVLFLTARPEHGGFGWSASEALALLGVYSFSMYAFPALGGFVADRVLGRRRAVAVGATFMLVGQVMLTSPVFLPELLGWWHGAPLLQALHELGMPLGRLLHSDALDAAIAVHGAALDAGAGAGWLRHAYLAAAVGFFVALFCLVARQRPHEVDAGGAVRRDHVHGRPAARGGVRLLLSRHLGRRDAVRHCGRLGRASLRLALRIRASRPPA